MPPSLSEPPFQRNALLPPLSPALARRIKQHVRGAGQRFFVVTAPGLESLCRDELTGLGIDRGSMQLLPGGIEFAGRLPTCYRVNLFSRLANRVLMRISEFKATGFAELEKKTAAIPWELFLYSGFTVEISVTARQSRLIHTGAIAERIERGLFARLGGNRLNPEHPAYRQRVFVRALGDRFTLSLDATDEPLYKRGLKTHGGRAPLRETGAAAILHLAGYKTEFPLLDPMCGSGTFSLEAALMARNIPPGWFRDFAFMGWPSFRERQWAHLRREAETRFALEETAPIVASDHCLNACRRLSDCLTTHDLAKTVRVLNMDFFDMIPAKLNIQPGLIVLNPPYGKRLGSVQKSADLIGEIGNKLKADFKGWRFALLAPEVAVSGQFGIPFSFRPFYHGGLTLALVTGKVT